MNTEVEIVADAGYDNASLIASAYNAIAAVEMTNPMTVGDTIRKQDIINKSLDIIEICIKELHTYATQTN